VTAEPTDTPDLPDIHTTAGKLADLELRLDEAVHAASEKAIEKQHAKGRQTARERIEMLFDEGSSSSSTSSPGTGPSRSGWRRTARTATA
jgi:propionyl-CoA carboxylase beta chain